MEVLVRHVPGRLVELVVCEDRIPVRVPVREIQILVRRNGRRFQRREPHPDLVEPPLIVQTASLDASRVVVRDVRAEAHVRAVAVGELGFVEDELARRSAVDEKANRSRGTREVHDHGDVAPFVQRHAGFGDVFVIARLAGVETDRALRDIGFATTLGVVGGDTQLGTQRAHRPTVVTEARDVLQLIQSRRFYPRLKRQRARRFRDERAVEMA